MREITTHVVNPVNDRLKIEVMDEPGPGGANHHYRVKLMDGCEAIDIEFQKGGIAESGVNGLTHEVLLAIIKDRLECFQAGPFPSPHNANALSYVDMALFYLQERTRERMARGVEGKVVE